MNINMTNELKIVIPKPNIYTIDFSDETLKTLNDLILKNREADGIVHTSPDLNKCPACNWLFIESNQYCPHCGQRVRFVKSDVVPL